MDRRNTQRFITRIRNRGKAVSGSNTPAGSQNRKLGKWAGWTIFTVVALLLCSVAFSGSKVDQSFHRLGTGLDSGGVSGLPATAPTSVAAQAYQSFDQNAAAKLAPSTD